MSNVSSFPIFLWLDGGWKTGVGEDRRGWSGEGDFQLKGDPIQRQDKV